jgi:hypothetical protein
LAFIGFSLYALLDPYRLQLGDKAQFGRLEGVFLGYGFFGTIQAVKHQLPKERIAYLPADRNMLFALVIDQIDLVSFTVTANVDIFSQLDISVGAQDKGAAVAPHPQAIGGEPIDPKIVGCTIIGHQGGIAEVFQFRVLFVIEIGHLAVEYPGIFSSGKVQKLLDLVTADITRPIAPSFINLPAKTALSTWSRSE